VFFLYHFKIFFNPQDKTGHYLKERPF